MDKFYEAGDVMLVGWWGALEIIWFPEECGAAGVNFNFRLRPPRFLPFALNAC